MVPMETLAPVMNMVNVFIVDDEPFMHVIYSKILSLDGHIITGNAFNGKEAVEMISNMESPPDIILMDNRMPVKNGLEASRELLERYPAMKILLISADGSSRETAEDMGVTLFLEKPVSMRTLRESVAGVRGG